MPALASLDRRVRRLLADERVRFLLVGTFNTGFGFAVYSGQVLVGVPYVAALLVAHVVSVLVAYVVYRRFVFRVNGRFWRDLPRFWGVYLTAIATNLLLLPLLVETVGLGPLLAQLLVLLVTTLYSYVGHKHVSFARSDRAPAPEPR